MKLAGVQFPYSLKIYDFNQIDIELKLGERVVVETVQGQEIGRVVYLNKNKRTATEEIKPILRKATEEDLLKAEELKKEAKEYMPEFEKQVKIFELKMKPVVADISIDEKRLTFYFVSENRVDFRDLVRELARVYKKQIRLLQIGSRDAARIMGGFGRCGREVCCQRFLIDLESITMDMAREQNITQKSGSKISGICGRLMCCLAFEIDDKEKIEKEIEKQIS
ncbi:TPA: hypothetical protein DDW69_00780 [candidate division CPR2 bacterium]|uniref:PSP1 domain protein n=1 Tax=candidate division CPR2 bacterium GW2011_GWC1_41_48 TaxID=1618344 RepID=A0A0G0W7A2_UNCC2|nr:MAG: PSP1 domain protein [candidate division CPR2 bacterium GW2011_GWC2_39_35]KKR28087.1 MAG: PSP1 domain protein [candidate division CPR2 bacterium GW2011_GWD2_39_7]KKS08874.1 MAG: PSP1 domain protein [candidate division CPR2 bacterium GW2011_GWC1_41_48]OGB72182.1 MAG: hypothetical protein A2Y26_00740 [candidate division CPR2 bacterium GWD2_39_7]HBG81359.1 hypothetical protein [candidate division CPR2 bacterium]